jgi:hypothetical protein
VVPIEQFESEPAVADPDGQLHRSTWMRTEAVSRKEDYLGAPGGAAYSRFAKELDGIGFGALLPCADLAFAGRNSVSFLKPASKMGHV